MGSSLLAAVKSGDHMRVREVLEKGAVAARGWQEFRELVNSDEEVIVTAAVEGDEEMLEGLLQAGVKVTVRALVESLPRPQVTEKLMWHTTEESHDVVFLCEMARQGVETVAHCLLARGIDSRARHPATQQPLAAFALASGHPHLSYLFAKRARYLEAVNLLTWQRRRLYTDATRIPISLQTLITHFIA